MLTVSLMPENILNFSLQLPLLSQSLETLSNISKRNAKNEVYSIINF